MPNPNSHNSQDWGVFSNTREDILFDEVFGDAKECGIRFKCVKPTMPKHWQCKGVGQEKKNRIPTEIKDFVIDVKQTTTSSTTTKVPTTTMAPSTTRGLEPKSNCTEKQDLLSDQLMKKMEIGKIAFISVSAFSGILLVIVITLSICYSKRRCKKTKVTINEPKKRTRNSTWYDLDITRASRQSSTEDVEQPPFEYKSVIVMQ